MKKDIEKYIKKFGSVGNLKYEICLTLQELSEKGYAESNINQIIYWSKMLLKLKNEY